MLEKEEYKRYNRHLILEEVGQQGQLKLKAAKVLMIGAGGLGCPILQYLTAAGVGNIGIIDFDVVDVSNLQRQILFASADVGKNKAEAAATNLKRLNPFVNITVFPYRLTVNNALRLFDEFDIIVDGTDNFSTRYLVNDASIISNKPLVYGSIYKFQGQISVFNYKNGPSYRCLFPEPPKAGTIKNCSEIGVIGILPGIVGVQQANEVIKIILEIGETLSGRLLIYDALKANYMQVGIHKSDNEIQLVLDRKDTFESYDYDLFCGIKNNNSAEGIDKIQLNKWIGNDTVQIVDLREGWEEPALEGANVQRITMSELADSFSLFAVDKTIVLVCQTGVRSNHVKKILKETKKYKKIVELSGGLTAL